MIEIRQVHEAQDFVDAGVPADNETLRKEGEFRAEAARRNG